MASENTPVAKFILMTAAFVVVVAGMKAAESLLVPFLLSIFIALIVSPLLTWLRNRRIPNGVAILLVISLVALAFVMMGALLGASISDFRQNLPEYQARLQQLLTNFLHWLEGLGLALDRTRLSESFNPGSIMQLAGNTLASLGSVMTNAFMILLTVIFILAEEVGFKEKLMAARANSSAAQDALNRFAKSVNSYVGLKSLMSGLTGGLIIIWLLILDVDYPVMWGVLAFMLNFVPTIGSIIAAVPAVLLALIQAGPLTAGLTALGYIVVNVLVGNVLEPRWMGRGLNLSPLVVFLSLVFWGWVLGPVGMLLSIPLTMLVKIALENDPHTAWAGVILGAGSSKAVHGSQTKYPEAKS